MVEKTLPGLMRLNEKAKRKKRRNIKINSYADAVLAQQTKVSTSEPVSPSVSEHKHHWRIGEPNGPTSEGCCNGCGARRPFNNWLPDLDFVGGNHNGSSIETY